MELSLLDCWPIQSGGNKVRRGRYWISLVVLVLLVLAGAIIFRDRSIYRRSFGDHVVMIWISADDADSDQKKIHGSYYPRFALMSGYRSVNLPKKFRSPTFTTIEDKTEKLVCIYDNNSFGFLMLVDQSDNDWYVGGMHGGVNISKMEKWIRHYNTIRALRPEIPYGHYFDESDPLIDPQ